MTPRQSHAERLDAVRARRAEADRRPVVWSYGGGTQTAAIAVLVLEGRLPRPERVVMADTGREASETWDYLADVVGPALDAVGLRVEVAPHTLSTVDLHASSGRPLPPVYTRQPTDGPAARPGQLSNYCSGEWKRNVVRRYLRAQGYGPEGRSERGPVTMWLGMSADEVGRLSTAGPKWILPDWPLCTRVPMNRAECVSLVRAYGWPDPPKSSCWMCPYRTDAGWRRLRESYPDDFAAAVEVDRQLREGGDGRDPDPGLFLHRSGVPLDAAELDSGQLGLRLDGAEGAPCTSGFCFT